jgi:hypothetical protein
MTSSCPSIQVTPRDNGHTSTNQVKGAAQPLSSKQWNRAVASPHRTRFDCGELDEKVIQKKRIFLGRAKKTAPSKYEPYSEGAALFGSAA